MFQREAARRIRWAASVQRADGQYRTSPIRAGKYTEQALVTTGNDLTEVHRFLPEGANTYTAEDVVRKLLCCSMQVRPG